MNNEASDAPETIERTPWHRCLVGDRLKFVRTFGTFLVSLWMAWYVGPEDFGFIQSSLVMAVILATLTSLGIEGAAREAIAKKPSEITAILGTSMGLRGLGGAIGFAILLLLAPKDSNLKGIWLVLGLLSITQTPLVMAWWLEHGPNRRVARFAQLGSFTFTALFLAILIHHGAASVWFAAALVFEQPVQALILFFAHLKFAPYEDTFTWDWTLARSWLRTCGKPLRISLLPFIIIPVNQLLSLWLSSPTQNGLFGLSMLCYGVGLFVLQSILIGRKATFPSPASSNYTKVEAPAGVECYDAAKLGWLVAIGTAAVSSSVILLFLNSEYHRALWSVLPLSFALVPTAIGWVRDERLNRAQRDRELRTIYLVSAGINLVVAATCIHFFGAIGAASATVLAAIVTNLIATHRSSEAPRLSRAQWRALILALKWQKPSSHSSPIGGTISPFPMTNG